MAGLTEPNQVGKREDLSDIIANVDSISTPFTTAVPKGTEPVNTLFDWQVDAYRQPKLGGIVDGVDVISTDYTNEAAQRQKLHGRVQKFRAAFSVSDLAQNVSDVAGVGKNKEMARAVSMAIKELKRDLEATFCSDQDSQSDNGTLPYLTRGMGRWISNTAQADLPVPAGYLTPASSILTKTTATTTEADINALVQSVFRQTGINSTQDLICGTSVKTLFTSFATYVPASVSTAPVRQFNQDAETKTIIATVDVWQGDFGGVRLVPSLWLAWDAAAGATQANIRNGRGYLIDWSYVSLRNSRSPAFKENPDLGGGPRGYVDSVCGLQVSNPLAFAKIAPTA